MKSEEIPPRDMLRRFDVPVKPELYDEIRRKWFEEKHLLVRNQARHLNTYAESLVVQFLSARIKEFERTFGMTQQQAFELGYAPPRQERLQEPEQCMNTFSISLNGMARYLIEQLPVIEPTRSVSNAFYQKSPESIIEFLLRNGLAKKRNEA